MSESQQERLKQVQHQIHAVLTQNQDNRLTFELINGLTARLALIVAEASETQERDDG